MAPTRHNHGDAHPPDDPTWAVVVIHGVGDTGPGKTLEAFLPTLRETNPHLVEIAQPETRMLPEPPVGLPPREPVKPQPPAKTSNTALAQRFPVHIRRFSVQAAGHRQPTNAVFAETYWADLSTAGEGTLKLLLRLFTAIFDLRYIPYVAAACPKVYMARWLRLFADLASWVLCGPIAGLTAFMVYMLGSRYAITRLAAAWVHWVVPIGHEDIGILMLAVVGVALAGGLNWLRARRKWREHWSFVINWIIVVAVVDAALTLTRLILGRTCPWDTFVGERIARLLAVSAPQLVANPFSTTIAILLAFSYVACALVGCLTLFAFVAWVLARLVVRLRDAGPALDAALVTTLLQIGLWVIAVPAIAAGSLKVWSPRLYTGEDPLFTTVWSSFCQNVALVGIVVASGVVVAIMRWLWVKRFPEGRPGEVGQIPRLIVNIAIVTAIILVSLTGTGASLYAVLTGTPRFDHLLYDARTTIVTLVLLFITVVFGLFRKRLGNALHILMDVVSHFDTDHMTVPSPFRAPEGPELKSFVVQLQLEARFRAVLDEVLQLGRVTKLTVVAHSQGTMIAIDVLWLEWAARRLEGIDVALVTMGSPFTHLYQHYFPARYPALFLGTPADLNPKWGTHFQTTVNSWINIYRVDDFVGMAIAGNGTFPHNLCIHPGGHTGYWCDAQAIQEMSTHLPGQQRAEERTC